MRGVGAAGRDGATRLALGAAGLLALFAVLFAAGSALGVWPQLPPGAFLGWDLWVGMAAGLLLLIYLARGERVES